MMQPEQVGSDRRAPKASTPVRSSRDDAMSSAKVPLMLVSADAGESLRAEVRAGLRPCPEYLRLEDRHGVRLLDWSGLGGGPHRRSVGLSLRHAGAALAELPRADVVLSDGEHVGIPSGAGHAGPADAPRHTS